MTVLAPDPAPAADELELLIREARRRQRRRRLATVLVLALAGLGVIAAVRAGRAAPRPEPLLARPLHLPALGPGGRCPASTGRRVSNPYFTGDALGRGPVRVVVDNEGNVLHGRPILGTSGARSWYALQTLWFALPRYGGPFVVRAARLGRPEPIDVRPGGTGVTPGSGPLVVPAGPTINTFYSDWRRERVRDPVTGRLVPVPTGYGYRTVPGSTWVRSAGCYAWQVDGRGFSEVIVFDALTPPQPVTP